VHKSVIGSTDIILMPYDFLDKVSQCISQPGKTVIVSMAY